MMNIKLLVQLVVALPRGGARIIALLSRWIPRLQKWPLRIPLVPNIFFHADLRESIFYPLLKYGCYPHQIVEDFILCTILQKEDVVVDVGANIGYVSAVCAHCVGPQGKVIAFEPSRMTRPYLIELSKQLPQLQVMPYAVADQTGTVNFVDEKRLDLSHIDLENKKGSRSYAVPSVTLDQWATAQTFKKLHLLKIDTEGVDVEVIQGAQQLISTYTPLIEFEAFTIDTIKKIAACLTNHLKDNSEEYLIYRIVNPFPFSLVTKSPNTNNYLAIPKSKFLRLPVFLFEQHFLEPVKPE